MEKKTIFCLEGNVQSVSGYTLKISNLPKGSCPELKRDLWKHFSEVIQIEWILKNSDRRKKMAILSNTMSLTFK